MKSQKFAIREKVAGTANPRKNVAAVERPWRFRDVEDENLLRRTFLNYEKRRITRKLGALRIGDNELYLDRILN